MIAWDRSPAQAVISVMAQSELIAIDDAIVKACDDYVSRLAKRFRGVSYDDLYQLGRLALLEAARVWATKAQRTAQFWTFARRGVLGAMVDFATREASRQRAEEKAALDQCPDASYRVLGEAALFMGQPPLGPEHALLFKELFTSLSEEEADILAAHIEGQDIRTIAEERGESKSSVHRTLTGTLENLRERV